MSYDPSKTGTFTQVNMLALQPMMILRNEHNYHLYSIASEMKYRQLIPMVNIVVIDVCITV